MNEYINLILEREKEYVISLRRELHKRAELSDNEFETAEFIEEYLKNIGYAPKRIIKTGVIAYLDCGFSETVLLRADMDALPLVEDSDIDYKSKNVGVMHACGHDAHMAVLLCTAKILKEHKEKLDKNILFVFQPAEETDGGANRMIQEGILEQYRVSMALGMHVMNEVPVGKIMIKSGALMASPDDFEIKIMGVGGHGSMPDKCVDPIATASLIVPEINDITNMVIKDGEKQVVRICQIHGGTSTNIIPSECVLSGTARSFDEEVREEIPKLIEKIINEEAKKTGAKASLKFNYQFPPLINSDELAKKVRASIEKNLGDIVISWNDAQMTGDDFSYFAKTVPSLYMFLGTGNQEKNITMPLHSDKFEIDEDGLIVGVGVYVAILLG